MRAGDHHPLFLRHRVGHVLRFAAVDILVWNCRRRTIQCNKEHLMFFTYVRLHTFRNVFSSRLEQEATEQGRRIKMDWTTRSRPQNGPQKVTEYAHINSTYRTWRVLRSWNFCRTIFALQDSQGCGGSGCIMHEDHAGPSARFATQSSASARTAQRKDAMFSGSHGR